MLLAYLRRQSKLLALLAGSALVFAAVFALYDLPLEAVAYAAVLCGALGLTLFAVGYAQFLRRHRTLVRLLDAVRETVLPLPAAATPLEADYQALVNALTAHRAALLAEERRQRQDALDYFALWAHQIKTPIAAAGLLVQAGGEIDQDALGGELVKIEEYVEMALGYLRLDSETSDYVLRCCGLDGIVRAALRKYARLFILKKLRLEFQETGRQVLTDEKWLGFLLGQLLSNAVKYTPEGGVIRIYGEGTALVVADSGIGICPEDLPRVFEKGFTGYNGRREGKSTGIGLYLCRQVAGRLGHGLELDSRPGAGTVVRLLLDQGPQVTE